MLMCGCMPTTVIRTSMLAVFALMTSLGCSYGMRALRRRRKVHCQHCHLQRSWPPAVPEQTASDAGSCVQLLTTC
jgi:hypothetical protein